jgi:hypothetical protein
MRILNVIELMDDEVQQLVSFPIEDDQLSRDQVRLAEELFTKIALENGVDENDVESYIEDGRFSVGDWSVNIVWSDVKE